MPSSVTLNKNPSWSWDYSYTWTNVLKFGPSRLSKVHTFPLAKNVTKMQLGCLSPLKPNSCGKCWCKMREVYWGSMTSENDELFRKYPHFLLQPAVLSSGVQPFAIYGPHWKKKSCLRPYFKYTNSNENWWAKKKVLSKFTILCWASFIATLGHMWPMGCGLDTPG